MPPLLFSRRFTSDELTKNNIIYYIVYYIVKSSIFIAIDVLLTSGSNKCVIAPPSRSRWVGFRAWVIVPGSAR